MEENRELIVDAFNIAKGMEAKQRRELLVLLLADLLKNDPEKAMRFVVQVRESKVE